MTVGLPGTGLFYTRPIALSTSSDPTLQRVSEWYAGLEHCNNQPFDPARYAEALNQMKDYQISDADLPPELLSCVEQIRAALRDDFGYRIEKRVPPPTPIATVRAGQSAVSTIAWIFVAIAVSSAVVLWFTQG